MRILQSNILARVHTQPDSLASGRWVWRMGQLRMGVLTCSSVNAYIHMIEKKTCSNECNHVGVSAEAACKMAISDASSKLTVERKQVWLAS